MIFAGDPDPYTDDSAREDDARRCWSSPASPGVSALVGETAKGGPADNTGCDATRTANHAPVGHRAGATHAPAPHAVHPDRLGNDADGDPLTYLWEQTDAAARTAPGWSTTQGQRPAVPGLRHLRRRRPTRTPRRPRRPARTSPTATRPDLPRHGPGPGRQHQRETGSCPAAPPDDPDSTSSCRSPIVDCYSEFLPIADYVGTAGTNRSARRCTSGSPPATATPTAAAYGYDDVDPAHRPDRRAVPGHLARTGGSVVRRRTRPRSPGRSTAPSGSPRQVKISLSTDGGRPGRARRPHRPTTAVATVEVPNGTTAKAGSRSRRWATTSSTSTTRFHNPPVAPFAGGCRERPRAGSGDRGQGGRHE